MAAMELWATDGAPELQGEALHPLQPASTVGCNGPCSYTPCACDIWLDLTTSQKASALNDMHGLTLQFLLPKHCPHTLTGIFCLPLLFAVGQMHTCKVISDPVHHLFEHSSVCPEMSSYKQSAASAGHHVCLLLVVCWEVH